MVVQTNNMNDSDINMTVISTNSGENHEATKLKRTFTLPRNPFNSTRMSKRKFRSKENEDLKTTENNSNESEKNKKVFRRPSIRKFINKIAQHINGVNIINSETNLRVPAIGLQSWGPDQVPGVTGLVNHGNTCFINAVLQCIAHTDILAEYFVLDRYKIDLSKRNKMNSKKFGSKGEITEQLALLLKSLWACQYNPELTISFKQVVEKYGSQYKGRQQHDALEFLQWLLDKVHEDLNTASKKKFKSIKTSGRPDEVIAAETLENYKRCNNSFIQGVFQAQYRSSLSCSRCQNQSNTFDPFQCISVQLPQVVKQSVYVTVLYTSQQPRQVKIGLSIPSGGTVSDLRDVLQSDTSINRSRMLITEIVSDGFHRTFTDTQPVSAIVEDDPIYCIEVPELKDLEEDSTSPYVLLCWINVVNVNRELTNRFKRFGSPYTMQVSRDTSYEDLQKLILKEMAPILHDDVLTSFQPKGIFKIRLSDPACDENEPPCYLEPHLEHPLFMEAVDQALALCSEEGGPPHVKLVLEWTIDNKESVVADDTDLVEDHSSVKQLRAQSLQGVPLTLEECLRDYTGAETLTDAWRCPNCQKYQPVVKTLDVWSLPDILIVHFKRFRQQGLQGTRSTKLTTMVDFPVYGFDMSPHLANKCCSSRLNLNSANNMADTSEQIITWSSPWRKNRKPSCVSNNDNVYDLYAVCYHHGTSLGTGHYTAACKNPYDNQWYLYDDSKVTNLSKEGDDVNSQLVNNSAYILFYQKRNGTNTYSNNSMSNSSSAASTSSVGSSAEHWVCRMPRFQPPKHLKTSQSVVDKITSKDETENENSPPLATQPGDNERADDRSHQQNENDVVALRNSENTLRSSNNSLPKSVDSCRSSRSPLRLSRTSVTDDLRETGCSDENKSIGRKNIFTTSIFIDSTGKSDIITTNIEDTRSPVLSPLRIEGISEDEISVSLRKNESKKNDVYYTTAAVHRNSDIVDRTRQFSNFHNNRRSVNHLNWMSPQPTRKMTQSQQSM